MPFSKKVRVIHLMTNVPSTAIIAVIGIVAACVLAGFVISAVMSQRRAGQTMERKLTETDVSNREDDYLKYSGSTMDGASVLSIIKIYSESPVAIQVVHSNGKAYWYNLQYDSTTDALSETGRTFDTAYSLAKNKNIKNAAGESEYISPADNYKCTLDFSPNGAVRVLKFTQQ